MVFSRNVGGLKINKAVKELFKGTVSVLRQFSATESPLKIMKSAFYLTLKSSFRSQDI